MKLVPSPVNFISICYEPVQENYMFAALNRFVRFVSTPEILERVYTIETEILQLGEAIAFQNSNDIGQSTVNH